MSALDVLTCRYVDFPGVLPWLVINRWMGSTTLNPHMLLLDDRAVVPVARVVETGPRHWARTLLPLDGFEWGTCPHPRASVLPAANRAMRGHPPHNTQSEEHRRNPLTGS